MPKPARSAFVPKYCLHKPSGRAYVRIRGKVVHVGEYSIADSQQTYGRVVAELGARPALPLPEADGKITVVELCGVYRAAHEKKFSGVADDQRAFAFQRFSAIMKHEMNNCSSMVSQAAQTLRDIGGPRDGITPH